MLDTIDCATTVAKACKDAWVILTGASLLVFAFQLLWKLLKWALHFATPECNELAASIAVLMLFLLFAVVKQIADAPEAFAVKKACFPAKASNTVAIANR